MNRIEIIRVEEHKNHSIEDKIISSSMNGWILQLYNQYFNK